MYDFVIKDSRLSLLGATTGCSIHNLLAHYSLNKISDGCDNRFLYHFTENELIPYDLVKKPIQSLPSLQQVFVVIHLIGYIVYTFVDSSGNDEAQRYYANKGRYYLTEGKRLFHERKQPHLQSFYSKSAEIFPRLCVNMQRFLDAMAVLLSMKNDGCLIFSQVVDGNFVEKAKTYISLILNAFTNGKGEMTSVVTLETCQTTGVLHDNYLFKTTMALFNLDCSPSTFNLPSAEFKSSIGEKLSIEKRILQLPFQFFLRADLTQPTTDDHGRKSNGPFHHVDGNQLNRMLDKLVEQKLLKTGSFLTRPKARPALSYMKNPIPNDPKENEYFVKYLRDYKIDVNEYKCLLVRSNLPNRCALTTVAIAILTSGLEHHEDCLKYGLQSTGLSQCAFFTARMIKIL
jgi:hypothetical protein